MRVMVLSSMSMGRKVSSGCFAIQALISSTGVSMTRSGGVSLFLWLVRGSTEMVLQLILLGLTLTVVSYVVALYIVPSTFFLLNSIFMWFSYRYR
jgi:hypothetical protein